MTSAQFSVGELPYDIASYLVTNETLDINVDIGLRVASVRIENGTGEALVMTTDALPSGGSIPGAANVPPGTSVRSFPQGIWNLRLKAGSGAAVKGAVRVSLSEIELPDTSSEYGVGYANVFTSLVSHNNAAFGTGTTDVMSNFVPLGLRFREVAWRIQLSHMANGGVAGGSRAIAGIINGPDIGQHSVSWLRYFPGFENPGSGFVDSGLCHLPEPGIVTTQDLAANIEHDGIGAGPGSFRASAVCTVFGVLEPAG